MGIFSVAYSIGAAMYVSPEQAQNFMDEFEDLIHDIDGFGIFSHNLTIALPMFIPGFGMFWGLFSAWATGMAFSSFVTLAPELQNIPPLSILYLSPFGIMELAAYSLGISRSFLLIYTILKKLPITPSIKPTAIEIGIVVGLLLAGGYLEFYMLDLTQESGLQLPGMENT